MTKTKRSNNFKKHVIDASPLITYIISNHLWLEHLLIRSLFAALPKPEALFQHGTPSFPMLVALCEAHSIIESDFAEVLRKVNALRNKFAHRLSFEPKEAEVEALLKALREMNTPFLVSFVPPSEKEMMLALASISGYLERRAIEIGATELEVV